MRFFWLVDVVPFDAYYQLPPLRQMGVVIEFAQFG
jgi:hypothetical protein